MIQKLHALVMGGGSKRVKPTEYRDSQNVIRDSASRAIVYLPPEAKDVPQLMKQMVKWTRDSEQQELPCAIRAGIAHFQFATIHPFIDGNGRTARLLTGLVLHLGGYDLKGLYALCCTTLDRERSVNHILCGVLGSRVLFPRIQEFYHGAFESFGESRVLAKCRSRICRK